MVLKRGWGGDCWLVVVLMHAFACTVSSLYWFLIVYICTQ